MQIRQVRAELFHADGQTDRQKDMTKLIVTFRIFSWKPEEKSPLGTSTLTCESVHCICLPKRQTSVGLL